MVVKLKLTGYLDRYSLHSLWLEVALELELELELEL